MPFVIIDTLNFADMDVYKVHTTSVVGGPLITLRDCRAGSEYEGKLFDGFIRDYQYTHLVIYQELRGKAYYREIVAAFGFDAKKRHIESLRANRASDHVQAGLNAAIDYIKEQMFDAIKDEAKNQNPAATIARLGMLAIGSYHRKDEKKVRFTFKEDQRGWIKMWRKPELVAKVRAIVTAGVYESFVWEDVEIRVHGEDIKYRAALDNLLSEGTLDRIEQTGKWAHEYESVGAFGTGNYGIQIGNTAEDIDTENPKNIVYNFLVATGFKIVNSLGIMEGTLTYVIPNEQVQENVRTYGSIAARAKTNRRVTPY